MYIGCGYLEGGLLVFNVYRDVAEVVSGFGWTEVVGGGEGVWDFII